jgi:hypothetical protein
VRSLGKRSAIHVKESTMARAVGEETALRPFRIDRKNGGGLR